MKNAIAALCLVFLAAGCDPGDPPAPAQQPNIVLMIIDDMGWTDARSYGSTFYETPAIDRLAREGVRFTSYYAASPVCSPTRASLMTGKHPARVHITNWIGGEQNGLLQQAEYLRELPLEEVTLGEAFRDAGYATGYIGKWHLGGGPDRVRAQGFDQVVAVNHGGQPSAYFYPYAQERSPQLDVPDLEDGTEGEYLTDRLTDEAVRFLEANRDGPFLLVLSHYAVHTPLQAKDDITERFQRKADMLPDTSPEFRDEGWGAATKLRQDHAVYAAMLESTDQSVARVTRTLDSLGIADNTIVVFVSDNGGLTTLGNGSHGAPTAVLPLRAGKGWLYEGGIRAPLIITWPGTLAENRQVDRPVTSTDLFPTLLELAGLPAMPEAHADATPFTPSLSPSPPLTPTPTFTPTLYFHFPHYHGSGNRPSSAVRQGDYKLIEWLEDGRVELYNLATDLGETTDLSLEMPEKAVELRALLHQWREGIGAAMPGRTAGAQGEGEGGGEGG